MPHWTLSEFTVQWRLREAGLVPGPGSPLNPPRIHLPEDDGGPIEDAADLQQALTALATPDEVLGVATARPAEGAALSWFYAHGDEPRLAFHLEGEAGEHRIAWPFDHFDLLDLLLEPLAWGQSTESADLSVSTDARGLLALAALVDATQEAGLRSVLDRTAPREQAFAPRELFAVARRGMHSSDVRWMVPRLMLVTPVGLRVDESTIAEGLERLRADALVERRDGLIVPGELLQTCIPLLGACGGVSALAVRRSAPAHPTQWALDHFAASRGFDGRIWSFEFAAIDGDGFDVTLRDTDMVAVHQAYASRLMPTRAAPEESAGTCRSCGAPMRRDALFCAQCGTPST